MTARALFAAVWRRRWLALIVFVVEIGIVVAWLAVAPRKYTATATISATPSADLLSSTGNFDALEQTVAQIANSRSVLADVHDRTDGIRPIWKLREEVSGTLVDNTVLVRVSVVDKSPEVAARVANAVATVLPLHDPSGGMFVFTQTDPASVPQSYSSPNTKLIALVGAVLGVFLAVAAALIRDRTARTVETPGQLRAYAGTDVLASVPRPRDPWDLTRIDAEEPIAGALRSLRVELDYASSDRPTGAIVIADANASAGDEQAPWLAVSLATSLAQVNHRVLVIDGDFRAPNRPPQLSRNGRPGLVGVLSRSNAVDDAIHVDLVPGVDVLPAGDANPLGVANLIELEFQRLLGELSGRYDAVLVIAPPASASDDARVMAIGGSLLLVVAARTVRESRLREIIADLRATRTRVLGAVLIAMRQRVNA